VTNTLLIINHLSDEHEYKVWQTNNILTKSFKYGGSD